MNTLDTILGQLKENGHRLTKARKAIVSILLKNKKPVAALELHKRLTQSGTPVDKVTVYRELAFLEKVGIAGAVTFKDGLQRYELLPDDGHKHHLICTECKDVQDVDMEHSDLEGIEKSIGKKKKFRIKSHSLEFYGVCAKCE